MLAIASSVSYFLGDTRQIGLARMALHFVLFARFQGRPDSRFTMTPEWWNWQTRCVQGAVG